MSSGDSKASSFVALVWAFLMDLRPFVSLEGLGFAGRRDSVAEHKSTKGESLETH